MPTKAQKLQALEDAVITSAEALVLAVLTASVQRGVSGLNTYAGNCLLAIEALRRAKKLPPL